MTRAIVTFLLLFGVWLAWSGHTEPLIVGFGVAASALSVYLAARLKVLDAEGAPFHLGRALVTFVPWLAWQILKANIDTAKLILHPKLPIRPHLLRVPANQKTELGQVIHANTITITPGTVSLDLREGTILIHALTDQAAQDELDGRIDERICRLEGTED